MREGEGWADGEEGGGWEGGGRGGGKEEREGRVREVRGSYGEGLRMRVNETVSWSWKCGEGGRVLDAGDTDGRVIFFSPTEERREWDMVGVVFENVEVLVQWNVVSAILSRKDS